MLDIREIEYWISRHEEGASDFKDCVTLSALYAIRDRMRGEAQPQIAAYSSAPALEEPLGQYGNSEFLQAVAGLPPADAWAVMDEHMRTLRVVNPRVYNSVMQKLQSL